MTQFFAKTADSYAFIVSADTGGVAVVIAPEVMRAFADQGAAKVAPAAQIDALLSLMGTDAAGYLSTLGQMMGMGDDFAAAYAEGGIDALMAAMEKAGAGRSAFLPEGFGQRADVAHLPAGFDAVGADDLADMLGFAMPSASDGDAPKVGTDDGAEAAIKALIASQSHVMENWGDELAEDLVVAAGVTVVGAAGGALVGSAVLGVGTGTGAVVGAVPGVGMALDAVKKAWDAAWGNDDDDQTPLDPTVDGSPSVMTDQAKAAIAKAEGADGPDADLILTDPDAAPKGDLPEDKGPGYGLIDPEEPEFLFADVPDFEALHLEQTTQPDPEDVGRGGGELPSGPDDSEAFLAAPATLQAGATEYIILLVDAAPAQDEPAPVFVDDMAFI